MDEAAVASLKAEFPLVYDARLLDRPDELMKLASGARALIVRNRTQVRGHLLASCRKLVAVGRLGVGLDNIDVDACRKRGIAVIPATGANDVSVAEYVIAGVLVLLRGAFLASARVAAGEWPREALIGREVHGKRLGLIGFGAIGCEVAARAHALGLEVVAHDPYLSAEDPVWQTYHATSVTLDELLATSDAVSLHVPLSDETRDLINGRRLARMKPSAVLINAARGGVVDEAALAKALTGGKLAGALLDVYEREPLPAGSVLDGVPHLILTPHVGGVTRESNARVSRMIADKVRDALRRK